MKRRDLVRILIANGFVSAGGTKHEKFVKGRTAVIVKRHSEIHDEEALSILRQAGLR